MAYIELIGLSYFATTEPASACPNKATLIIIIIITDAQSPNNCCVSCFFTKNIRLYLSARSHQLPPYPHVCSVASSLLSLDSLSSTGTQVTSKRGRNFFRSYIPPKFEVVQHSSKIAYTLYTVSHKNVSVHIYS